MKRPLVALFGLAIGASACGGAAVPQEQLTAAQAAIRAAEVGGAPNDPQAALLVKKCQDGVVEAKKLIERALELSPEDLFIVDSLGWVLYRMGDLPGAAAQLKRAWNGRNDGEIGAHYGEVLWQMGERDEARRIWQEAQKVSPENETLQKTLKKFKP